jgi:hypothetical protein
MCRSNLVFTQLFDFNQKLSAHPASGEPIVLMIMLGFATKLSCKRGN